MHKLSVGFLTAGQRGLDSSLKAALALIAGGIDILEIGVPFSDPVADGQVIQKATYQSLQLGTTIFDVLNLTKNIRMQTETPIVLFSYYNPILQAQKKNFFQCAKQAGVDGILVVDLPLEESFPFREECYKEGIAPISVIAPSTPLERIKLIVKNAKWFIYYACRKGTTGIRQGLPEGFAEKIGVIKSCTSLPVVAGFGISSRTTAKEAIKHADGFVVGSFYVAAIENGANALELTQLAREINPKIQS